MNPRVVVVNTLGAALSHYSSQIRANLEASGASVDLYEILEPSASGKSSWVWLGEYGKVLIKARRDLRSSQAAQVIVTWPVLGFLDLVVLRLVLGRRAWLVMHDPIPLVRARGYGRLAQWIASAISPRSMIVHSRQALDAVQNTKLRAYAVTLPLPIHRLVEEHHPRPEPSVVRVLGQYKADRDLDALRSIAGAGINAHLDIAGRRWPELQGWTVRDEFIPEDELDSLIDSSSVVVIPYRRFYQSAIALRALERGVPIVGPAGTSLDDVMGSDSRMLARGGDWVGAVSFAIEPRARVEASDRAGLWYLHAVAAWRAWAHGDPS